MQCTTSFFNPALFRNHCKRFWPLPVTSLLVHVLVLILPLMTQLRDWGFRLGGTISQGRYGQTFSMDEIRSHTTHFFYSYSTGILLLMIALGFLTALLVTGYLHSRRSIQFYHGLPMTRLCCYVTDVISGYVLAFVPALLVILAATGISLTVGIGVVPGLSMLGAAFASFTVFFALGLLSSVLAGDNLGSVFLFIGLNCAAAVIGMCTPTIFSRIVRGMDASRSLSLLPNWLIPAKFLLVNLSTGRWQYTEYGNYSTAFHNFPAVWIYTLAAAAVMVLTGALYQKRRDETAGSRISFRVIKLLCKIFGALVLTLALATLLLYTVWDYHSISFPVLVLLILVIALVSYLAAEMVVSKSVHIFEKRIMAQAGLFLAALLLILSGAKLDVVGYTHRIPEESEIQKAYLGVNYQVSEVEPAVLLRIHEAILDNLDAASDNSSSNYGTVSVEYLLNSGDTILRTYNLNECQAIQDVLEPALDLPGVVYQSYFPHGISFSEDTFVCGSMDIDFSNPNTDHSFLTSDRGSNYLDLTQEESRQLYDAIVSDIYEGNLKSQGFYQEPAWGCIIFETFVKQGASSATESQPEAVAEMISSTVFLYPTMANTFSVLAEMGIVPAE